MTRLPAIFPRVKRRGVIGMAVLLCAAAGCAQAPARVCLNKACVRVELAADNPSRQKGLMNRPGLAAGEGMLFVFDTADRWGFWMMNMRFPIDIIWISAEGAVVSVKEYALPCKDACASIYPQAPAQYVLEVEAGFCRNNGVREGTVVANLREAVSRRR